LKLIFFFQIIIIIDLNYVSFSKLPFNNNKTNFQIEQIVFPKVVPMGAIVIRTRFDEGTESAKVAMSVSSPHTRLQQQQSI
jgi:hypothetical protein